MIRLSAHMSDVRFTLDLHSDSRRYDDENITRFEWELLWVF